MKPLLLLVCILLANDLSFGQADSLYNFRDKMIADIKVSPEQYIINIGEYEEALKLRDKNFDSTDVRNGYTKEEVKRMHLCDARQFILNNIKYSRVVMMNEGHHNPYTRAFTMSLLKDLYNMGFRYFSAEAITWDDSLINERGFPVLKTIYYDEPVYGELIREALQIGFKVFSYECILEKQREYDSLQYHCGEFKSKRTGRIVNYKTDTIQDMFYMDDGRDLEQAENIYRVIQNDPSAKILIHAGYGHILKDNPTMGGKFIQVSNINPFCIDQIYLEERSTIEKNDSIYQLFHIDKPVVLCDSSDFRIMPASWNHPNVDAVMIHPLTKYINGRPDWMNLNGTRKPVSVEKYLKELTLPIVARCYYENEYKAVGYDAIPADAIEIDSLSKLKSLMLSPGKYVLHIRDKNENVVLRSFTVQ